MNEDITRRFITEVLLTTIKIEAVTCGPKDWREAPTMELDIKIPKEFQQKMELFASNLKNSSKRKLLSTFINDTIRDGLRQLSKELASKEDEILEMAEISQEYQKNFGEKRCFH